MQKVAVFGNAGDGKSTLSQQLAAMTGLPWVPLDRMKYKPGGDEVPMENSRPPTINSYSRTNGLWMALVLWIPYENG